MSATGLTFDSGGYNLKVNCGIELMKQDMAGAAAVLGAARAVAALRPQGVQASELHDVAALRLETAKHEYRQFCKTHRTPCCLSTMVRSGALHCGGVRERD